MAEAAAQGANLLMTIQPDTNLYSVKAIRINVLAKDTSMELQPVDKWMTCFTS